MKTILLAICTLAMLSPGVPAEESPGVPAEEWTLVWSDEFDYRGLPDAKKWGYEEGFVRNNEMQYYTRARKENARVENGVLVIEGRKEQFPNPRYKTGSKDWREQREFASCTAASLVTRDKASWKYGRVEVRAKLPRGKGKDNPLRKPHYLLINLALGGTWGGPIDQTILPQKYLIDYVRVYEAKTEGSEDPAGKK